MCNGISDGRSSRGVIIEYTVRDIEQYLYEIAGLGKY
jgi:hypothetical protein